MTDDRSHAYTFADDHVTNLLNDRKTATVRVEDERDVRIGDVIHAQTTEGSRICDLDVKASARIQACYALGFIHNQGGQHLAFDTDDLLSNLNGYYPDIQTRPGTPVHAIVFDRRPGGSDV